MCTAVLFGWDSAPLPPSPYLGSYTRELLVSKDRQPTSLCDPVMLCVCWERIYTGKSPPYSFISSAISLCIKKLACLLLNDWQNVLRSKVYPRPRGNQWPNREVKMQRGFKSSTPCYSNLGYKKQHFANSDDQYCREKRDTGSTYTISISVQYMLHSVLDDCVRGRWSTLYLCVTLARSASMPVMNTSSTRKMPPSLFSYTSTFENSREQKRKAQAAVDFLYIYSIYFTFLAITLTLTSAGSVFP